MARLFSHDMAPCYLLEFKQLHLNKPNLFWLISVNLDLTTVDSEMFARTSFSLIFANSLPLEFKVLANIAQTYFNIAI